MSLASIKEIVKIKESFLSLLTKKIEEVQKIINKLKKEKPKFGMAIKRLSRRQVLVLMSLVNSGKFMVLSNKYMFNISRALKKIKSNIMANFIWINSRELIITTTKVAFSLDLNSIEKYIKNVNVINSDNIMVPRLPQSKLFLKILGILYLVEDTSFPIISNIVEKILQSIHIFNNVTLTLRPHIIKALPKSDMVVI